MGGGDAQRPLLSLPRMEGTGVVRRDWSEGWGWKDGGSGLVVTVVYCAVGSELMGTVNGHVQYRTAWSETCHVCTCFWHMAVRCSV